MSDDLKVRWVLRLLGQILSTLLPLPHCSIALMWQYLSIYSLYLSVAGECYHKESPVFLAAVCVFEWLTGESYVNICYSWKFYDRMYLLSVTCPLFSLYCSSPPTYPGNTSGSDCNTINMAGCFSYISLSLRWSSIGLSKSVKGSGGINKCSLRLPIGHF